MSLRITGLVKSFGGVRALDGVDLAVPAGQVHALLGHNGAGKSTLIKCLGGAFAPDSGVIEVNDTRHTRLSPRESIAAGIGIIFQTLSVVDSLTVAENIFLGQEWTRLGMVKRRKQESIAAELLNRVAATCSPRDRVADLPMGQRQLVEIANYAHPRSGARHYVIHGDFASLESLAKLATHGYGVNMNPSIKWTISDLMDSVVGARRSAYQWPVRSAFEAGVTVCASSDAPVTEPDWRQGVAGMLLRESKASGRRSGPDECVGLADALRAYTINPARQDFAESWKGSVEVGKVADLCVLDRDLIATDPHDIPGLSVDLTVFDGQVVFERSVSR